MTAHETGVKIGRAQATVFKAGKDLSAEDEAAQAAELRKEAKRRNIVFAPNVSIDRMLKRLAET